LQALTEKTVTAVGRKQAAPINARVVASTEADLNQLALRSEFSADLLVALAGERLDVLPLRRRREEILVLATDLALARFRELRLTADAAEALLCWPWPANVRELDALLALYATLGPTGGVDADFLYDVKGDILQGLAIAEEPDEPDAKDPRSASRARACC
jgi:DNA-binding NtrC family response regulator